MVQDYLDINRETLERIKAEEGENSARYRTLLRYLECQNIYARELEKGEEKKEEAWKAAAAHWNTWAKPLLEERRKLEEDGKWKVKPECSDFASLLIGRNKVTREWLKKAEVDFSALALREGLTHHDDVIINRKNIYKQENIVIYQIIVINLSIEFFHFPGNVGFTDTHFYSDAQCSRAYFHANIRFWNAHFHADALFWDAHFYAEVSFWLAKFEHPVTFENADFQQAANFSSIRSRRSFLLHGARFGKVPDFNEAEFHEAPVLDDISVADQLDGWRWKIFRSVKKPEENAKKVSRSFRALGRMAHEARDWLNEMEFFAQETRTRRFGLDTPFGRNPGRFWFGLFYEKFSNFGRSMWRPFAHWLVLTFAFFPLLYLVLAAGGGLEHMLGWLGFMVASMTIIYFWASRERRSFMRQIMRRMLKVLRKPAVRVLHHFIRPGLALAGLAAVTALYLKFLVPAGFAGEFFAKWADAWMLSLRQGMVVSGVTRNGHLMTTLKNLYGTADGGGVELSHSVAAWMIGQTVLSAICFFFLFLALRNHFRIR